jgi:hypothetical protein
MKTLMMNGIGFVSGDPTLKLNQPQVSHPSIRINCSIAGDLKWIYLPLPLNRGDIIKGIKISYKNSNARSFISQIRLADMVGPDIAHVKHDDPADLLATSVSTKTSTVANVPVNGSMVLELRLNYSNIADTIEIGAVEIDCA